MAAVDTTGTAAQDGTAPAGTVGRGGALEVGFHDTTLGWLSVRASVDQAGDLHAALATHNPAAASAVSNMLPALGRFLQQENVAVQSVSSSAQMSAGVARDAAAQAGGAGSSTLGQSQGQAQSQAQGQAQQGSGTSGNQQRRNEAATSWHSASTRDLSTAAVNANAAGVQFAQAAPTSTVSVRI